MLADYVGAFNAFDQDAIAATFVDDALVTDVHRKFWGDGKYDKTNPRSPSALGEHLK